MTPAFFDAEPNTTWMPAALSPNKNSNTPGNTSSAVMRVMYSR